MYVNLSKIHYYSFLYPINKLLFNEFGKKSKIIKPIFITPRWIKIKNYVSKISGSGSNDEAFQRFINDIVLVHFEHGKAINSNLSRHAIMHGADKTYGNYLNSLKAILLFNAFLNSPFFN